MNRVNDLKTTIPIGFTKRTAGAVSGTVDTDGAHLALVRFFHGTGTSNAMRFDVRAASASTTLFASATALRTVAVKSAQSASGSQVAFLIDLSGCKRHLKVKTSAPTASSVHGCVVDLFYNRTIPPGTSGLQGFTSVTTI